MLSKEERHFIYMCGMSGHIFGARLTSDKKKSEVEVQSKYSDPVYLEGYKKLVEDRLWKERLKDEGEDS